MISWLEGTREQGGGRFGSQGGEVMVGVPHGRPRLYSAVLPETSVQLLPITPGMYP